MELTSAITAPGVNRLRGKICIITGAGQGIGRAAALRMAEEGANIVVVDLHQAGADRTAGEVRERGVDAETFVGDLMNYATAVDLMQRTVERFSRIDAIVNNIGGATAFKPYEEWEPDEITAEMNRSILPTMWCCRAVLPIMIRQAYGRIVNVGAESVRNGLWDRAPYSVGKGGVHALTTSIARENATRGIVCNCVAPGATNSGADRIVERGIRTAEGRESEVFKRMTKLTLETIPMDRFATSGEQAAAIAFLASDDASFITGQILSVNGGSSMI
jgi:dihydroxycyclohexadiene carboxylate dehydrogenase